MAMDGPLTGVGLSGGQAVPWSKDAGNLTPSVQASDSLPQFIDLILGKTQEAMEAATAAAGEAMHLMASAQQQEAAQGVLGAQMQQQSYLAAEAAMESAENALAVAVRLLQDTQQLVLAQGGSRRNMAPMHPMPAQLQDPELQDTCDSLAASMCAFSAAHSCSSTGAVSQ